MPPCSPQHLLPTKISQLHSFDFWAGSWDLPGDCPSPVCYRLFLVWLASSLHRALFQWTHIHMSQTPWHLRFEGRTSLATWKSNSNLSSSTTTMFVLANKSMAENSLGIGVIGRYSRREQPHSPAQSKGAQREIHIANIQLKFKSGIK